MKTTTQWKTVGILVMASLVVTARLGLAQEAKDQNKEKEKDKKEVQEVRTADLFGRKA